MLDISTAISVIFILSPVVAALIPLTSIFDLNYKDAKKRFEEIGKNLTERKIENWRYVFLGQKVNGVSIAVSDDHIANVLRQINEGDSVARSLKLCRKAFYFYYVTLLIIFCLGVVHGFFDFTGWFSGIISVIAVHYKIIIALILLYVIAGIIGLFLIKHRLDKKYEKYLEI